VQYVYRYKDAGMTSLNLMYNDMSAVYTYVLTFKTIHFIHKIYLSISYKYKKNLMLF